jgi:hypothetical protein
MTGRKMVMLGVLSLFGLAAFDADAQACKKHRRGRGNDCAAPAPCDPCGGGRGYGMASPYGGMPLAMPVPGSGVVLPAGGFSDGTRVVPAGVNNESYYLDSHTGNYYPRSSIDAGSTYYPGYTPADSTGRSRIFRR